MSVSVNTATVVAPDVPTRHPDSHEAIQSIGDTAMTGGGPVNSSSVERWTTSSSSSPVQSTLSSPYNPDHTPKQNSTIHTPSSSPQSATSWLRRLSPTLMATNSARLERMLPVADSALRDMDATNTHEYGTHSRNRRHISTPISFRRRFFVPYTSGIEISGAENKHD